MKQCLLFTGGPLSDCDQISLKGWDSPDIFTIACDAGLSTAAHYGVVPKIAVGDFDSFSGGVPSATRVVRAPAHKDETDTMLGLMTAVEHGCADFLLVGALGGRLDHTIGNLQLLSWLCEQGFRAHIRANRADAWMVKNGSLTLLRDRLEGRYISVFAWGGVCKGVTLEGLEYPLFNYEMVPSYPIGVSNRFAQSQARISVREGTLLVLSVQEE